MRNKLTCSIGVIAYNEEKNIAKILDALLNQELVTVGIKEIIIVSSGCTDKTDEIAQEYAKKHKKIKLIIQEERKGKSSAINLFIENAKSDLLIIQSADTIPAKTSVEKLIKPFKMSNIGMTGGRPIPVNKSTNFIDYAVNLLWKLHHKMAMFKPKLGEMIAFRKVFESIPERSAVDEASIEAIITANGLKCLYVSDAIVYNKGPETISDFIKQRKRIAIGHLWLQKNQDYQVSSSQMSLLAYLFFNECFSAPKDIPKIIATAGLEIFSRAVGYFEYYLKGTNPFIWDMVKR
jgi:cellulose synthase/poly-beta-1,6-N-acetylglucosamine synthase-like glycosyltransferase